MIVGSPTKLNLIPSGVMPVVYINQGDAGYDKEFLIYNGDSPYNVPSGVSATIRGTKADGYGVTEAATVTTGSNLVTVTITEQMVAAAGKNVYELVFVDTNDLRVASINMVWAVKKDALGDSVISDSDLDYADQVLNQLQSVSAFKTQLDSNTRNIRENADDLAAETAARIAADETLQRNINLEASTRYTTDTSLQAQINQLVAPSGGAPSAAEVQNARIGANGVTYDTLGDAIRSQDTFLTDSVNGLTDYTYPKHYMDITLEKGGYDANGAETADASGVRWRTRNYIYTADMLDKTILVPTGYDMYVCVYNSSLTFQSRVNWTSGTSHDASGFYAIRWTIVKASWTAMTWSEANCIKIETGITWYDDLVAADNSFTAKNEELDDKISNIIDNNPPYKYMDITLEMGGYAADGSEQTDTSGVKWRTPDYIYVSDMADKTVTVPTGYVLYVCVYDSALTFQSRINWESGAHDASPFYAIRWTIVKASWTAMTEEEANCIKIKEVLPWYSELYNSTNPLSVYPDYYESQIATAAENHVSDMLQTGINGDEFVFITDIHWSGNYKHSPSLIYYIKEHTNINFIVGGGDLIDRSTTDKPSQIAEMQNCVKAFKNIGIPFMTATGNHDRNSDGVTDSTLHLSESETASITQNPVSYMPAVYSSLNRVCFYFDRPATKTRYIYIDSGYQNIGDYDITTDEITWAENVITQTNADWHIIVVVHKLGQYQSLTNPVSASNTFVYTTGASNLLTMLDSLLATHKIEAIFTGHTHYDANAATSGGIPIVWTNSDAKWQYYGMTEPADGTVNAQCFDIVAIDYSNKKISLRRVGRGLDRTITY